MKMDKELDIPWQVKHYEEAIQRGETLYLDVEDFEEVIDHYLLGGLFSKALGVVEAASSIHTASIALILKKAQLFATLNNEQRALELLAGIEDLDPSNHDVFLTKGAIYSQLRHYEKAIEEYNKAINGADEPDFVYCNIAFEYENLGNFDKTIEYLDKALKINPDNDLAIYEAAYCFDLLSLTDEGISFFARLIDRNPFSIEAWFNLGVSYINAGLHEKALEALDYALAIESDHEHSWFHKGYVLNLMNRHEEAIQAFLSSMDEHESDAMKFYYVGECHEKLEDYVNARDFYMKSTNIDPELADAWVGIGVCDLETGKVGDAVTFIEKGLTLDTGNISYLCLLANAYFLLKDNEMGCLTYERALSVDSEDEDTWLEYAEALHGLDKIEEASQVVRRGLEKNPGNNNLLYCLSGLLFMQHKSHEAAFCLEEAHGHDADGIKALLERFPGLSDNTSFVDSFENLRL